MLNFDHKDKKYLKEFQPDSNILASPKAGQCNSLTVALCIVAPIISCESGSEEKKIKDKIIVSKIDK